MITLYTFSTVAIISLISFIGALALALKKEKLDRLTKFLVALSTGTLLGDAFLHLLPEIIEEKSGSLLVWFWILGGIIAFFVLEKIVFWHHCHLPSESHEHHHRIGTMNIIGDGLHNFIDGVIIAGSFLISIPLGIATAIAIIAHEIPQEISDFGILIYSGFKRSKALLYNFLSASASIAGAGLTLIVGSRMEDFASYIIPFTAGGFIYIATADLMPELHKETAPAKSIRQLGTIIFGILLMWFLKIILE